MTREDLRRFCALDIDFEAIGLLEPGQVQVPYFCTPAGAEPVGRLGVDGIHFVLLPGDERVFCVDPAMGEPGTYVLPVGQDFRTFLSYVLYCRDASPLSQIWWLSQARFDALLAEEGEADWPGSEAFFARRDKALETIQKAFCLEAQAPYAAVRAQQAMFDPGVLRFSAEYYDVLGIEED